MFRILTAFEQVSERRRAESLLKQEGFSAVSVSGQRQLISYLENRQQDMLIISSSYAEDTPGMIRLIREADAHILIAAVMQTEDHAQNRESLLAGADECIAPGTDDEEFILIVKAVLRRAGRDADQILQAGSVTMDARSMTVTCGKLCQTLPRKEFLLLYKLLSYPGKIFTRSQLMMEVWGSSSEVSQATLNVHINRLRKRFGKTGCFYIKAIRGIGYKAELPQEAAADNNRVD